MPTLNPKHELFCQLYAGNTEHFGNGTQAYIAAYAIDSSDSKKVNGAAVNAAKLLRTTKVRERCRDSTRSWVAGGTSLAAVNRLVGKPWNWTRISAGVAHRGDEGAGVCRL
jgi:hypothetical protein